MENEGVLGKIIALGIGTAFLAAYISHGLNEGKRVEDENLKQAAHEAVVKGKPGKTVFLASNVDGSVADKLVCEVKGKGITPGDEIKIKNFATDEVIVCTVPEIEGQAAK
jgi:hypothetical protein